MEVAFTYSKERQLPIILEALKLYIKTEIDPLKLLVACTLHKNIVDSEHEQNFTIKFVT